MKKNATNEAPRTFDLSDTPDSSGRRGPPPVPTRPAVRSQAAMVAGSKGKAGPAKRPGLPGVGQESAFSKALSMMDDGGGQAAGRGSSVRQEATPFGGPDRRSGTATGTPPGGTERRRSRTPTSQFQLGPDTPLQKSSSPQAMTGPGEHSWDVYVNGAGVYKVPASDEETAKSRAMEWLNGGGDPEHHGRQFSSNDFQAVRTAGPEDEGATVGGSLAGYQEPISDEVREAIRLRIREVVRKKAGGGGFKLYAPNQGKKKDAKPVGEFPTKVQAKEAELQRFPPRDPEQLKRARKRLDKLRKDPKKRIEKEKESMSGRKGKKVKKHAAKKSAKKEALIRQMVQELRERLFREDEIPGSPWDERISGLHPDAIASDKKLDALHRGLEGASIGALGDGHKLMAKALRGIAKVHPGEHAFDPGRKKMYLPIHLDVGGTEVGPVHLYVDGGHVKIEVSQDARQQIAGLEPGVAKDLRGGLMSLEEDHLPKVDRARKAWGDRDAYLDKIHGKLEKHIGGMSGVEAHLAKALLQKHGKGKK